MPSISVIIPAYNAEETIRAALDSVAAQAFGDVEVIVVDDASTDGTSGEVKKWVQGSGFSEEGKEGKGCSATRFVPSNTPMLQHSITPVLITLPRNAGPAAARNRGVAEAKGEWIAFLDGDDAWLPGKLEAQIRMAAEHPDTAMWCGPVVAWSNDRRAEGGDLRPETRSEEEKAEEDRGQRTAVGGQKAEAGNREAGRSEDSGLRFQPSSFRQIPVAEFAMGNPVATSTVLVKKEAVLAAGGFDEQFRGPEDYDLWMRMAAKYPVMKSEAPLAMYRERAGSLSLDERTFLPQVMRVLDKAFGPGGVFCGRQDLRRAAVSNQLWNASWMAFCRGDRGAAVSLWWGAFARNLGARPRVRRKWFRLLLRYLAGKAVKP